MKNELTKTETTELKSCETIIEKTQASFVECGNALSKIRDEKLFRVEFKSFEEYCKARWGWTRMRASQLIEAATVKKELPKSVNNCLQNEGQARAVAKIPKEKRVEVLKAVAKKGKVTATAITNMALEAMHIENEAGEKLKKQLDAVVLDKEGYPIPQAIQEEWNRADKVREHMAVVSKVKCYVEEGVKNDDPIFREVNANLTAELKNLFQSLKRIVPHAVCGACNGVDPKKCRACSQRGFISEFLWSMCVPQEIKKMRKSLVEK